MHAFQIYDLSFCGKWRYVWREGAHPKQILQIAFSILNPLLTMISTHDCGVLWTRWSKLQELSKKDSKLAWLFENSSLLDDVLARQLFKCMIRMSGGEVFKMCKISEKFQVWLEVKNIRDLFQLEKSSLDLDALKFLVQRWASKCN